MSTKREMYNQNLAAAKQMVIKKPVNDDNSVDSVINELEKPYDSAEKIKPETVHNDELENVTVRGITLDLKAKEFKKVRKSFAISENLNRKFVSLAKENGVSENELMNKILEQILG